MKASPTYAVPYRRKRIGKTDYKTRLKLLKCGKMRLVIRRSLKNIWLQVVEFSPKGDKILVSAHSRELRKLGWKVNLGNLPAAYLCGLLLGKKAKAKKITSATLDIGLSVSVKGAIWYAALKGVVDSGISVPHAKEILPDEKRIRGEHIAAWASKLKQSPDAYNRMFGNYLKAGVPPESLPAHVEEIKKKVMA
ncbi:MAG: 50S ribosomal protein L18 [Candidatus Woesearchaeota archaeon]